MDREQDREQDLDPRTDPAPGSLPADVFDAVPVPIALVARNVGADGSASFSVTAQNRAASATLAFPPDPDDPVRGAEAYSSAWESGLATTDTVTITRTGELLVVCQRVEVGTHDALTGLANRVALLDEIGRALAATRRSGRASAVLMLDLDHFKDVNDALGHAVGDDLLQVAARRIEQVVRSGDLVARQGGDEFVIVMREISEPAETVRVGERIIEQFRAPIELAGADVVTTASLGIAVTMDGTATADDLLREADTAMYLAKEQGRDRWSVYDETLRRLTEERAVIETELREALERDQFTVWYQPEVDLDGGSVLAVEALLRWRRPSGEIVPAERFISIAADNGQIVGLGSWAIERACAQAAEWARTDPDHPVTVRINLSTLQVSEPGFLDALDDILTRTGLDPRLLAVEVTEATLLRQVSAIHDNLEGLHRRGVRIAIEHFGTGYASLALLRDLPISMLRLDRSFVHAIVGGSADRRLVSGVLALARQLGLAVSAEGVETEEQAELLRRLGCVAAQGFLYSPALPPEQVTRGRVTARPDDEPPSSD